MKKIQVGEFARRTAELVKRPDGRIVWFLGAGCSISSGIPGAAKLVEQWIPRLQAREDPESGDWRTWAATRFDDFDAGDPASSYGAVIDALFDLDALRQEEVERITSGKQPAVG